MTADDLTRQWEEAPAELELLLSRRSLILASGLALGVVAVGADILEGSPATAAGSYLRPCGNVPISDSWQGHKNRNPTSGEPGTDYSVGKGTAVLAATDGTIVDRKDTTSTATGRYLALRASDGNYIRYLHLNSSAVAVGATVSRGQVIASSGASGFNNDNHYGPHVHVSLWIGATPQQAGFKNTVDFETYVGDSPSTPDPTIDEDDMFVLSSPGRGIALVGVGYFRSLSGANGGEEVHAANQIVKAAYSVTDSRFDTIRDICTSGFASIGGPAWFGATVNVPDVGLQQSVIDEIVTRVAQAMTSAP